MSSLVSVVIPSHNEGCHLVDTVASVVRAARSEFEVVVVDDGSTDDSADRVRARFVSDPVNVVSTPGLGVVGARNRGAAEAIGDVVVFLDAHCFVRPGWMERLAHVLDRPGVGLVSPAIGDVSAGGPVMGCGMAFTGADLGIRWLPRSGVGACVVPLTCGCCQALRRAEFLRVGGFDAGMTRWGAEDLEICVRLTLDGLDVVCEPRSEVFHLFRPRHPYPVDTAEILHNQLRLAFLHLKRDRFERVVAHYQAWPAFPAAVRMLLCGDARDRRAELERTRQRDDDWFCRRFDCAI